MTTHHVLMLIRMWRDLKGATAIEYSLIAALIAIASMGAIGGVAPKLKNTFTNVSSNLKVS